MSQRRVGIIGTGFMAGVHAAAWQTQNASLVAFLERSTESQVGDLGQYGAEMYTDLDTFLEAVDIVDICAPTHVHVQFALAAAAAGKPTICEKPLALDVAEGAGVIEAFRKRDLPLQVAHVLRFSSVYVAMRDAVRAGHVGEPAVLRLSRLSFAPKRGRTSWFNDESKSGGIAFDLMIHDLDYARWVAGDVASVYARTAPNGQGHTIAILKHVGGALSHIEGSWSQPAPIFRTIAEIAGSDAVIGYDSDDTSPLSIRLHKPPADPSTGLGDTDEAENPFELELRHFLDILDGGEPTVLTAADGLEAVRLAEATRRSAVTGRPVLLDSLQEARS
jgi:predicted dehydrogenase